MKTTKNAETILFASLITLLAPLSSLRATVLFVDNFTGSSTANLTAQSGSPWVSVGVDNVVKADGSFTIVGGSQFAYYTPFTMGAGGKWLISLNMTQTTRTNWFGLALDAGTIPAGTFNFDTAYNLSSSELFANGFTFVTGGGAAMTNGETSTYSIAVDNTGANTLLSYYKNSNLLNTYQFASMQTITSAGLVGFNDAQGKFNSFTIESIPEPSTWAMLALAGGIGALTMSRRRNS
jgi:hypothetical protein